MKIAFVYDTVYPFVKGGVEKRIDFLSRKLAKEHEVHVFGMKYWKGKNVIKRGGVFLHGVCGERELYGRNGKRKIVPPTVYAVKLFFALMKEDFDLIEVQNFPVLPFFSVKAYSVLKRKPFVLVWHEVWGDYWKEYLGSFKGAIGKKLEQAMAFLSKYNVVPSMKTRRVLEGVGNKNKRVFLVGNPIDFKKLNFRESDRKSDLIFVGRLIKEKNLEPFLNALVEFKEEFREKKFFIVGNGPEKQKLLSIKESNGLGFIEFFSGVEEQEMFSLLKASKVFVFPSKREGFGISAMEANACSLPVVSLDAEMNALTELILNGFNGFVCSTEKEMVEKCIELLEDRALLEKMKRNSAESAKRFDSGKSLKELKKVYFLALKGERN